LRSIDLNIACSRHFLSVGHREATTKCRTLSVSQLSSSLMNDY
jgi:hypothetical protein